MGLQISQLYLNKSASYHFRYVEGAVVGRGRQTVQDDGHVNGTEMKGSNVNRMVFIWNCKIPAVAFTHPHTVAILTLLLCHLRS